MKEVTLVSRVQTSMLLLGAVLLVPKTPRMGLVGAVLPRDTVRAVADEEEGTDRYGSVVAKGPLLVAGFLRNLLFLLGATERFLCGRFHLGYSGEGALFRKLGGSINLRWWEEGVRSEAVETRSAEKNDSCLVVCYVIVEAIAMAGSKANVATEYAKLF